MRGAGEGGVVPMTKSEVRAVALSKLRLTERAVCWDVGAGTGSVAIEMALQAKRGHVYAVERRDDAVELLKKESSGVPCGEPDGRFRHCAGGVPRSACTDARLYWRQRGQPA